MKKQKVLIMGAAGRDFHNFNTYFRGNEDYEVVAFTATQIPDIEGRTYMLQATYVRTLEPKNAATATESRNLTNEKQARESHLGVF